MVLRACPDCGASLDPSERCDCQKEKTAPVLQHRSGKVENGLPTNFSTSILPNFMEGINNETRKLQKYAQCSH